MSGRFGSLAADAKSYKPATPKEIKQNSGYWDGRNKRLGGAKLPEWADPKVGVGSKHPFDQDYGKAYWAGWMGEPHPVTGESNPRG